MAGFRFQFRKRFPIIKNRLYFTVSKTGVSLNLRAGPFSRSWGTRQNRSSVDMPGTTGISWEKRETKPKS